MIAVLGSSGAVVDEPAARRALSAVPYPTPDITLRRIGECFLGIATRPDFVDECISVPGDLQAVMTGRLDNVVDLAKATTAAGFPPVTPGDADVLVACFRAFGPEVVNRFRGCYACIVTDGRQLWAFRDHVGFRGLFYRKEATMLYLAGEARQVVVASGIKEEPNLKVVNALFDSYLPSIVPAALDGVARMPQGCLMRNDGDGTPTIGRYWHPSELLETERITEPEARERFLQLMDQACRRSVTGRDVILLSGGLDSPMVAAFAAPEHRRRSGTPLQALTAVFPDLPAVDERPYTELVAHRYDIPLETYQPRARALDDVELWSQRLGTPVPVLSIPEVYEAYTRARALGGQNVMTGEFAELTFGKWPHMLGHLLTRGRLPALWRVMREERRRRGNTWQNLFTQSLLGLVPGKLANWHFRRRAPQNRRQRPDWMAPINTDKYIPRTDYLPPGRDRWRVIQLAGTSGTTMQLEADSTVATMAGVSIRRPHADIDLWEFFMRLPAEIKFPTLEWKSLAKRSLVGILPDEILNRRKTLFNDHVMQQVDYEALRRYCLNPTHRLPNVNYARLGEKVERRAMGFLDWIHARELVRIHAFLSQW